MITETLTWWPAAEKPDGIAASNPCIALLGARLIALLIGVRKPLFQWRMLSLTIFNVDNRHTRFIVVSNISKRECVDDTVHLNFGRRYSNCRHGMPPKRLSGMEILA